MRIELKRLHQRLGASVVYVTHDQVEAMTMADRIVVMRDGRILQVGTPTDLYENPVDIFTARFIGSPSMKLLSGRLADGGLSIAGIAASGKLVPSIGSRVTARAARGALYLFDAISEQALGRL